MKILKQSRYYLGCYVVGEPQDNLAVLTIKSFRGKSLENLLSSNYSKMYSKELLESEKDKFVSFNIKTKQILYSKEYHVLRRTDEYYKTLVKDLGLDRQMANELKSREYDSKFKIENESLDISKFYKSYHEQRNKESIS